MTTRTDHIIGTFDVCLIRCGGPEPDDQSFVLRWLAVRGLEDDYRGLVVVQGCPRHDPDDEPTNCPDEPFLYEVVPYVAQRSGDPLYVKVDARFTLLDGPTADNWRNVLDWALNQGMEVSDDHTVQVDGEERKAIVVQICPTHSTVDCPDVRRGWSTDRDHGTPGTCPEPVSVYAAEVMGADWMGG